MTTIYRDFNRERVHGLPESRPADGFVGGIHIYRIMRPEQEPHHVWELEITVEGLQERGYYDCPLDYPCGQADVRVTVDPACDLYDAILAVLDRITADHQYKLKDRPYRDFVLCSDALVKSHPELCRDGADPDDHCYMGGHWMDFMRETLVYVDINSERVPDVDINSEPSQFIVIRGEVRPGPTPGPTPVFTYDAPIVSTDVHPRYYALTRGKTVHDVAYSDVYPTANGLTRTYSK